MELGTEKTCLKREHDNYKLPAVASYQQFRALHDLVLEGDVAQIWDPSVVRVMGSSMSFRGLPRVPQGGRFGTFRQRSRAFLLIEAGRKVSLCLG